MLRHYFRIKQIIFQSSFRFTAKFKDTEISHIPLVPVTHAQPPQQMGHLSQLVKLHWHIMNSPSPQFTLGLTLGVIHSVHLDKYMTCIHLYGILQSSLTAVKPSMLHPFIPTPQPHPLKTTDLSTQLCLFKNVSESAWDITAPFKTGFSQLRTCT